MQEPSLIVRGFICANGHTFFIDWVEPKDPMTCPMCGTNRELKRTWGGTVKRGACVTTRSLGVTTKESVDMPVKTIRIVDKQDRFTVNLETDEAQYPTLERLMEAVTQHYLNQPWTC